MTKKILVGALFSLLAVGSAFAQADSPSGPFQVRLEAYIGAAPKDVKPLYTWTVGYQGKTYDLQIMKHDSLSQTVSTQDINDRIYMYKPMLTLDGDDKAIAAFTSAKPGELMSITSNMRVEGVRLLELDTVAPVKK